MTRPTCRVVTLIVVPLISILAVTSAPGTASATHRGPVSSDFNGDGRSDLAVGAPHQLGNPASPGVVFTRDSVHGTRTALTVPPTGDPDFEATDLGQLIASCDLNGDRHADLVATTHFDYRYGASAWGVQTFYGSANGLRTGARLQEITTTYDAPPPFEALACGDINGDGRDEVAVGTPGVTVRGKRAAGQVLLYRGGPTGPTTRGRTVLTQESRGVPDGSEVDDFFGAALAFGDFDADGRADLAIGAPGEKNSPRSKGFEQDGAVTILRGSRTGFSTTRSQLLSGSRIKAGGVFGLSLAAGDLTGDGRDDLVVGAPTHLHRGNSDGAVAIFKGRKGSLRLAQLVTQSDRGVGGGAGPENGFGYPLALGDVNGDHRADLVVGATGQRVSGHDDAGSITVLRGSSAGVNRKKSQFVTLATAGVPGSPATNAGWPNALRVVDTSGDHRAEVFASTPGAVYRLPGAKGGVNAGTSARLTQADFAPMAMSGLELGYSLG